MKANICIDARMLSASGIGTYLRNIIPFLIKKENIILVEKKEDIERHDWGSNVKIIGESTKIYSIKEQFKLPYKIPNCDLFWSPHYNVPIFPIKAKRRIVTIHDVFHFAFYNQLNLSQKMYAKIVMSAATRLSDKIITVSEFSKSEIVKYTGVDSNKINVIYNGIDTKKFSTIQNQEFLENVRQKYRLSNQFLLFVGNVKPHKNLHGLIKAFGLLKKHKKLEEFNLVIVGKKEGFITGDKEIERLINELSLEPFIKFTGFVMDNDLPAIYNLASALIFPSFYEGFGFPPIEAMACGCPVIASNTASLPEVCGDAVLYVDPNKTEDIAQKIELLLTNKSLIDRLKEMGFQRVRQFTWEKCAAETLKTIEEIIGI
ncbi:MAG TPA: glycosyltransferase family 1 protein [Syntrophorhabdaceae bacterium]|nr:glycosyltransferase family 1 protein [Syntrophorhabdaceae bacterium]